MFSQQQFLRFDVNYAIFYNFLLSWTSSFSELSESDRQIYTCFIYLAVKIISWYYFNQFVLKLAWSYRAIDSSIWAPSSEFVSSSIPSWQILTAHAQPFRGARDLAFCLKVPLDSLLVWASSGGSGETARMRRLAWTFAARIGDKYQIRLTRSICDVTGFEIKLRQKVCNKNVLSRTYIFLCMHWSPKPSDLNTVHSTILYRTERRDCVVFYNAITQNNSFVKGLHKYSVYLRDENRAHFKWPNKDRISIFINRWN